MSTVIEDARRAKASAVKQREAGRFEAAAQSLEAAIDALRQARLEASRSKDERREIAECELNLGGSLGGIHRRWANVVPSTRRDLLRSRLMAAVDAYDRAFEVERDPTYGLDAASTYARIQRLVCRILLEPMAATSPDLEVAGVRVVDALEEARNFLDVQTSGPRRADLWALADAALVRTLLGEPNHVDAWNAFRGGAPQEATTVNLEVLDDIRAVTTEPLKQRVELARQVLEPETPPASALRPFCFSMMPFGVRKSPRNQDLSVDFDDLNTRLLKIFSASGVDLVRADDDVSGGLVHRAMLERILVSEYALVDLTFANANVYYELGIRHGAGRNNTLLIANRADIDTYCPFDVAAYRIELYDVDDDGMVTQESADRLKDRIARWLDDDGDTNPVSQVTSFVEGDGLAHESVDILLARMRAAGAVSKQIADIVARGEATALAQLERVAEELRGAEQRATRELENVLLDLFIAYRECKGYQQMLRLSNTFPAPLQRQPRVIEQRAFAMGRIAESLARNEPRKAQTLWRQAEAQIQSLSSESVSSETLMILGRLYKGQWRQGASGPRARGYLRKARDTYYDAFRLDPRDYSPGINALTLSLALGDLDEVSKLMTVVDFALDRLTGDAADPNERYWREATRLEQASARKDWKSAQRHLDAIGVMPIASWMFETTANTLEIHLEVFGDDSAAKDQLTSIVQDLRDLAD
ncbi:MAG: TRAFs-binding domain-containing protein [Deltaproteobacteria bacterium]